MFASTVAMYTVLTIYVPGRRVHHTTIAITATITTTLHCCH